MKLSDGIDGTGWQFLYLTRGGGYCFNVGCSDMIAEGRVDALVFFIDPLSALPHDVDVKSLLRLATLYNTLLAMNEATATAIFKGPLEEDDPQ